MSAPDTAKPGFAVMVPYDPTPEMVDAGLQATSGWLNIPGSALTVNREKMRRRWQAMIGAAGAEVRPLSEWHEEIGSVLWWCFPITEAPYVGTPLDCGHTVELHTRDSLEPRIAARCTIGGWPGYHTHWSRIPLPQAPPPTVGTDAMAVLLDYLDHSLTSEHMRDLLAQAKAEWQESRDPVVRSAGSVSPQVSASPGSSGMADPPA